MEAGYVKGRSDNLPKVDPFMVINFLNTNKSNNETSSKLLRSSDETYGDNAVGNVQVQRMADICSVKGRITPERHRARNKEYFCSVTCNEKDEEVLSVVCHDCASQGGCKHGIAFLMWLHRRSEEPPPSETKCYWVKPKLPTSINLREKSLKFIKAKDFGSNLIHNKNENSKAEFLQAVVQHMKEKKIKSQLMSYFSEDENKILSLHTLIHQYRNQEIIICADKFIDFCSSQMTTEECRKVEEATLNQADSSLREELRYCRVTTSIVHEAAQCKTPDEDFIAHIFGENETKDTLTMNKYKALESDVKAEVAKKMQIVIKDCGFFLKSEWPVLSASPNGLTSEYVVKIKCPMTEKCKESYAKNSTITSKCMAQIQLQMFFTDRTKGLFCLADVNFIKNKIVVVYMVNYDKDFCLALMEKAISFWKKYVFPEIVKT